MRKYSVILAAIVALWLCGCSDTVEPKEPSVVATDAVFLCDTMTVEVSNGDSTSTWSVINCNRWICMEGCQ